MNTLNLPNFLVIGAAKSGTTALYHYLNQHPQVYMSKVKEPRFFAFENGILAGLNAINDPDVINSSIRSEDEYSSLFNDKTDEIAVGEVSPIYLTSPIAPYRIKELIPNIKLIAILRNPVDRAYSAYLHAVRNGLEKPIKFSTLTKDESLEICKAWQNEYYVQVGFYHKFLSKYFNNFEKNEIKVYLYDDFKSNLSDTLEDIFEFLEVDSSFKPDISIKHNVGGIPKNNAVYYMFRKLGVVGKYFKSLIPKSIFQVLFNTVRNSNLQRPEPLPNFMRSYLLKLYKDDIRQLEILIDKDLSCWLKG